MADTATKEVNEHPITGDKDDVPTPEDSEDDTQNMDPVNEM